jgi:hypothetical protein
MTIARALMTARLIPSRKRTINFCPKNHHPEQFFFCLLFKLHAFHQDGSNVSNTILIHVIKAQDAPVVDPQNT